MQQTVMTDIVWSERFFSNFAAVGQDVKFPGAEEIVYTMKEREYTEQIEKAYNFASKVLLDLLMQDRDMVGRLR